MREKIKYLKNANKTKDCQELISLNSLEKLKELYGLYRVENIEQLQRIEILQNMKQRQNIFEIENIGEVEKLQQCEHITIMENLIRMQKNQQLEQLEHIPSLTFSSLSYNEVKITTPPNETIVYCDILYRRTGKYLEGKDFDYEAFYKWFENNEYSCFLSEYNAPFSPILEIPKMKIFNNKGVEKREYAIEKLFWNGK